MMCTSICTSGARIPTRAFVLYGSALALVFGLAACQRQDSNSASGNEPPAGSADAASAPEDLEDEVQQLVAFLRGETPLPAGLLGDSVTLYVAPEGGGVRRRVSGQELENRSAWRAGAHTFTPSAELTQVTISPGRHFNCRETALATRYEHLARSPHVGVRMARPGNENCLQTWNATYVFDGNAQPRLSAVVYDQWEW